MPILNKDIIFTKIQSGIDGISNTANAITLLTAAEALVAAQGNSNVFISVIDTVFSLPRFPVSNNQILYITENDDYAIHTVDGWYDLLGNPYPKIVSRLYSWGNASSGKLGDGTTVSKSSPVSVLGNFINWCQVSAAVAHTAAVRSDGTLWAWGYNSVGRLGSGTTTSVSSPVSVVGGFTDWCQVSTRNEHTTGLRQNGTLWAWGYGGVGRLGNNSTINRSSPVSVVGGFTDWCQVSAGYGHTAAVRQNGTLWSWGCNGCGRLGDNTTVNKSSPVSVVGDFTDWCQVSAGGQHTAAVRQNGTLWTWGINAYVGFLGNNSTINRSSPVSVVGGFTDWCQVSSGTQHTAAVRTNGTLWAWGCNGQGRLGDNTQTNRSSPVSVIGGFTDWCQVSAGGCHTAAVRTNGTLWTWGLATSGQLGNYLTSPDRSSPVQVCGGFTDWYDVSASSNFTVAIKSRFQKP